MSLTPTLAESAVRLGSWIPFGAAATLLAHFTHTAVSAATVTRLTERAGAAYATVQEAQYARLAEETGPLVQGPPIQQLSVDGAMVPLVHKQWVEAKTLAIGTVQPPQRTAAGTLEVHTTDLSYFSRVADHQTFTERATIETVRRGTLTAGVVCGVVDGALWEQEFFDAQRPDAVRILDWPHAVGYLATVAHALFGADTPEAHAWLAGQRETLLHGDPQGVLDTLRGLAADLTRQAADGPSPPALAVVRDSLFYLDNRADQLRYAVFRTLGYPIGSGAVESANKLVVEARLKGAGMHWALAHVNPLLALRTMDCSDRWEEGWTHLVHQWRTQARETVLAHRRRRLAARQAARARPADQARIADTAPPQAVSPPHVAPSTPPHLAAAPARTAPARSRRPAPDHPWHRRCLLRRPPRDPGM